MERDRPAVSRARSRVTGPETAREDGRVGYHQGA